MTEDGAMEQQIPNETHEITAVDRFPCPQCGADMVFDPETQALACPYCRHQVEISSEGGEVKEYDLAEGELQCSTDWGQVTKVIRCDNCGAETVLEANRAAQNCSFCGSAQVVQLDQLPGIKPESLIPFKITQSAAEQAFRKWVSSRFFAPSDLKHSYQAKQLQGIYIPFWTYDADTYSAYRAQKGTYYWVTVPVTVTRNGKTVTEHRQERRTSWRPVSGTYAKYYDDELVHASQRLDEVLAGTFGHYDLAQLTEYRPEYLSGFAAEKYTIGVKQGWERAKAAIKQKIAQGIVRQINGDEVRALQFTTSFQKIAFKHLLLPLWMSSYNYQGKAYSFIVNGQTGEVHGEAPVSALKVTACIALGLLLVAAIYLLVTNQ
jgi:predicted RNA-binding Zn-ribbon protein involved in translation (DUF1610 family)